jgi:hypothetical protein
MVTKLTKLHPSIEERIAAGKTLRDRVSRKSQGNWKPTPNRPDPIELLERADEGRLPELLPIRYGRMSQARLLPGFACRLAVTATSAILGITNPAAINSFR